MRISITTTQHARKMTEYKRPYYFTRRRGRLGPDLLLSRAASFRLLAQRDVRAARRLLGFEEGHHARDVLLEVAHDVALERRLLAALACGDRRVVSFVTALSRRRRRRSDLER